MENKFKQFIKSKGITFFGVKIYIQFFLDEFSSGIKIIIIFLVLSFLCSLLIGVLAKIYVLFWTM